MRIIPNQSEKRFVSRLMENGNVNSIDPAPPTSKNSEQQQIFVSPNSPLPSLTLDLQKN